VRIRNPYEQGQWRGDWCNESNTWDENPEVRKGLMMVASLYKCKG